MRNDELRTIWADAARYDPTLAATPAQLRRLADLRVLPQPYSRRALFDAMANRRPALLAGLKVLVDGAGRVDDPDALAKMIDRAFPRTERISVQTGRSGVRRRIPVAELVRRWCGRRRVVSITDLHVRGTRLEREIDTDLLSQFNLLPLGSERMRLQEMMTLVVSSRGNVTDSHSDDPDGSNHCFTGRKLWLAWDTFEGLRAGLQDVQREDTADRAAFDVGTFCRLRSACWWVVGPDQTLFLPGGLTHKVVTLDAYIGIGSFYVAPGSCLDSLSRWYVHGPLWSLDEEAEYNAGLVDEIAYAMNARLEWLMRQPARIRRDWGLDFVPASLAYWERIWSATQRRALMARPPFAQLMRTVRALSA